MEQRTVGGFDPNGSKLNDANLQYNYKDMISFPQESGASS